MPLRRSVAVAVALFSVPILASAARAKAQTSPPPPAAPAPAPELFPLETPRTPESSLRGSATDSTGAALRDVLVTARSVDHPEFVVSTRTYQTGDFNLPLSPGRYQVTAVLRGFASIVKNITVRSNSAQIMPIVFPVPHPPRKHHPDTPPPSR